MLSDDLPVDEKRPLGLGGREPKRVPVQIERGPGRGRAALRVGGRSRATACGVGVDQRPDAQQLAFLAGAVESARNTPFVDARSCVDRTRRLIPRDRGVVGRRGLLVSPVGPGGLCALVCACRPTGSNPLIDGVDPRPKLGPSLSQRLSARPELFGAIGRGFGAPLGVVAASRGALVIAGLKTPVGLVERIGGVLKQPARTRPGLCDPVDIRRHGFDRSSTGESPPVPRECLEHQGIGQQAGRLYARLDDVHVRE